MFECLKSDSLDLWALGPFFDIFFHGENQKYYHFNTKYNSKELVFFSFFVGNFDEKINPIISNQNGRNSYFDIRMP